MSFSVAKALREVYILHTCLVCLTESQVLTSHREFELIFYSFAFSSFASLLTRVCKVTVENREFGVRKYWVQNSNLMLDQLLNLSQPQLPRL